LQFKSTRAKLWAFGMMQFAHRGMNQVSGLQFYKLMGTGKEGFNPLPDWSVYAILQVWNSEEDANTYFTSHRLFERYKAHVSRYAVFFLKNKISRGEWDKKNPFQTSKSLDKNIPLVVVLTRATIKTKLLFKFWKFVPKSRAGLGNNEGLLYTKGVGEVPFRQMATLSVWTDENSLNAFAYQTKGHVKAIGKTRTLKWYKEELFARFQPYKLIGNWNFDTRITDNLRMGKT